MCPSRRIALAEIPPVLQEVELKEHKLDGLDPKELAELTRKCHLFRSIDLSGWKGVSLMSFRSLALAVGASLQTVREWGGRSHVLSEKEMGKDAGYLKHSLVLSHLYIA